MSSSDSTSGPPPSAPASGDAPTSGLGLGMFLGVYTPTVLTILGVILYLRMGWVVANAGVGGAMLIVLLANSITLVTALSMSALATNMRVGVGGAYYIISRSLGLELGGALGIPLYLSQALSVTLYAYGLAESIRIVVPGITDGQIQAAAAAIVVLVVLVAGRSTVLALKLQLPIMGLIGLSLVGLVMGADLSGPAQVPLQGAWEDGGFWVVFAVFFPAVTGVLAGVGLSGDLANPSRAIPKGVLLAVGTGFVVYMAMPWLLSHAAGPDGLRDPLVFTKVAFLGAVAIMPGLWGAVLSSAIGSILGAPRTLQALATDRLAPKFLGKLSEKNGEPMVALFISGGVALGAVALGDLNAVAAVVSMFFLTTYGMLNLAAALEEVVQDPHYRPRIRVPWWVSLLGAIGCFVAMFAINPAAFAVAVLVELGIWWYLRRRSLEAAWGDLRTGLWYALARFAMLQLKGAKHDPRNWRPHILVFTADLERNLGLVAMATHFSQDRGIVTVTTLRVGASEDRADAHQLEERNHALLEQAGVLAFVEVIDVPDLESGIVSVAQANGIGGLDSNMVAFGWPGDDPDLLVPVIRWIRQMGDIEKSSMWMRPIKGSRKNGTGELLVWWKGKEQNGDLMLLLAHLLSLSDPWRGCQITLCTIVATEEAAARHTALVEASLVESRILVQVEPVVRPPDQSVRDLIRERSQSADLVFMGLARTPPGQEHAAAERLIDQVDGLPSTILVRNGSRFKGRLV